MKRKGKHSIWGLGCLAVQAFLFIGLIVIEVLAEYRAGVMKHLYFKNRMYLATTFSADKLRLYLIVFLIGIVVVFLWRRKHIEWKKFILLGIYFLAYAAGFYLNLFAGFDVHVYVYMILSACMGLEALRIIFSKKKSDIWNT